ncbi:uncharacterized protein ATC70_008638 [Mucor velutinosus]|uniref:NADP-dependent oxidoreductase domain-containing protein n=1 Tax=Mucor velutinosus TaxID=708070 RepID=A0AAN7I2G6_9FUNG|nr:hypothetical protein ATC70_008638 [Mucor velutinosus]
MYYLIAQQRLQLPLNRLGYNGNCSGTTEVYKAIKFVLAEGYRHIDTAYIYNTEEAIETAIKEINVKREDLFVTTEL